MNFIWCYAPLINNLKLDNMKDLTKEELETTLELLSDEIRKIKKQYACEMKDGLSWNDYLNASEGFEILVERIEKKIKKCS